MKLFFEESEFPKAVEDVYFFWIRRKFNWQSFLKYRRSSCKWFSYQLMVENHNSLQLLSLVTNAGIVEQFYAGKAWLWICLLINIWSRMSLSFFPCTYICFSLHSVWWLLIYFSVFLIPFLFEFGQFFFDYMQVWDLLHWTGYCTTSLPNTLNKLWFYLLFLCWCLLLNDFWLQPISYFMQYIYVLTFSLLILIPLWNQ